MTPVTVNSSWFSNSRVLPKGFSVPKYFRAISSVSTMEKGADRAVVGLPLRKGNVKMSKTVESVKSRASS